MRKLSLITILLTLLNSVSIALAPKQEFYEIRIYHLKDEAQEKRVDDFLAKALIPALHRTGISNVGVFKPVEQDISDRKIFVLIPYKQFSAIAKLQDILLKDKQFNADGKDYLDASFDNPPYTRIESILLKAFSHHPELQLPALKGPKADRVYELRSYEGHTEKISKNKIHMFNEGGEVPLFKRLGFNAVFYGEVLAGPRMPNLMYMTTFDNKSSRDEHWKAFSADAEWKKLSANPEYQNNVSKNTILFLRPMEYSDY